jgi:hypothetical protein
LFAGGAYSVYNVLDDVDVYNSTTGAWSTARLSVARAFIAATSVGNVAIFAGGQENGGALRCMDSGIVDFYFFSLLHLG